MAALYKRYIPPKSSAPPLTSSAKPAAAGPKKDAEPAQPENKWKRVRTDDEVAERKAKKLRKKGIHPATLTTVAKPGVSAQTSKEADSSEKTEELAKQAIDDDVAKPVRADGDFSHIKNAKKRHQLEKEARRARKAEQKASNGGNEQEDQVEDDVSQGAGLGAVKVSETDDDHKEITNAGPRDIEEAVKVKKPKKKRKSRDVEEDATTAKLSDDLEGKPTEAPNGSPESVSRRDNGDSTVAKDSVGGAQPQVGDEESTEPAIAQPKKRRHKLETVLREPVTTAGDGEKQEIDHLRKHTGVLGKYQKAVDRAQRSQPGNATADAASAEELVLHDLVPLPQPEPVQTSDTTVDHSALPPWLARPTVIANDSKQTIFELGLDEDTVKHVAQLGFTDAMPVQQALMPLLLPPGIAGASFLPGSEPMLPDIAVGAATGSGKTIAYLLPIIESLKRVHGVGRLKALIVVPTRELVLQVAAVAESLAKGFGIKVGMATGTGKLKDEQEKLINHTQRYDPDAHAAIMAKAHRQNYPPDEEDEDFEDYLEELEIEDARADQKIKDAVAGLVDHVPVYDSAIDVLVCTPGRLLEHIGSTLGFTLSYLQWLVLDEADKLLDEQYDGLLETLDTELTRERQPDEQDARERFLRSKHCWDEQRERRVRKVVLSATMTRDVSKLAALKLERPRLLLVRGKDAGKETAEDHSAEIGDENKESSAQSYELPPFLVEFCVPVGDGSEKPLFLLNLLEKKIMPATTLMSDEQAVNTGIANDGNSDNDSHSDMSSELSSSSDESSLDGRDDDDEVVDAPPSAAEDEDSALETTMHPARVALIESRPPPTPAVPTILIFTSSNESATRLSHLLTKLKPQWAHYITTMTKGQASRKAGRSGDASKPSIAISTDRSARGLDLLADRNITHVVQYDVPRSLTTYVHRVGRTARAGHAGEAWTLYTHPEARWFLHEVTKASNVKRTQAVEKVRLTAGGLDLKARYSDILEGMRDEVQNGASGKVKAAAK